MKINILLALTGLLAFNLFGFGQQVSGEWYGVGNVNRNGQHSSYLSELVLRQKGNRVTGEFNYFFKSSSIVTKVSGTFDERTRTLELKAHPLLNYKASSVNGADCPMEGSFTLQVSKVESSLRGQFNPTNDYRFTCPAINVKFIKQTVKPKDNVPIEKDEPEDLTPSFGTNEEVAKVELKQIDIKPDPNAVILAELNKRTFETSPVIEVEADSLRLALYDNGEIDGDTISLFYNRKLVAAHKLLKDKPFNITMPLDTSVNEISMFAENLGSIPPNTALCVIYAGEQRFELSLSSSFIKNATLRFKKKSRPTGREIVLARYPVY